MIFGLLLMVAPVTDHELLRQLNANSGPWEKYTPAQNPFDKFDTPVEKLGAGPHTLVVSDGAAMTRMEYKSGPLCAKARDSIRRQVATPDTPGRIYGPPRTKAFCVPR